MTYLTYEVAVKAANGFLKFIEVAACSLEAAHADIRAAYGDDVEISHTNLK